MLLVVIVRSVLCVARCVIAGCCLLFAGCGSLPVVCCVWCDLGWLLFVACCSLRGVRCLRGVCGLSFVVCC